MNLETTMIPPEIRDAYEIQPEHEVTRLTGGLVNETLQVDQQERSLVLRRLAPILGENTVRDTCIIGNYLSNQGWEAPTIAPTSSGTTHAYDQSGRLWHALRHIDSDKETTIQHDGTLALHAGELIGAWHASTQSLDHAPDSLPHFHDTAYISGKLEQDRAQLEGTAAQDLASLLLEDYREQPTAAYDREQIIHGDPKLNNMLFRNGKPFTLIDFDCVMRDSVWTDVGDFLRSISGKLVDTGEDITDIVDGFIKGYAAGSDSRLSTDETRYRALQATRRIACELGMRYLSDIVDGQDYFSWDQATHRTRGEALYDKALLQYRVVQVVKDNLNED